MYLVTVVLTMLVLPVSSMLIEALVFRSNASLVVLMGKWFVVWAIGMRLFLAGLRQSTRPDFTAETILGIKGKEVFVVVRELGFANMALGAVSLCSIFVPTWVNPCALGGGLFLGLAAIQHLTRENRSASENLALYSNVFVCGVLLCYGLAVVAR